MNGLVDGAVPARMRPAGFASLYAIADRAACQVPGRPARWSGAAREQTAAHANTGRHRIFLHPFV